MIDGLSISRSHHRTRDMIFLFSLFACSPQWSSIDDCLALSRSSQRDDCLSTHAVDLFKRNPQKATQELPNLVLDPVILDYIWLKVTREYNPATQDYCKKIKDNLLKKRCVTLVRRPHLYRDRTK